MSGAGGGRRGRRPGRPLLGGRDKPNDRHNRNMLDIQNLSASVEGKQILKGLSLRINPGEVHAIMGPNGERKKHAGLGAGGEERI